MKDDNNVDAGTLAWKAFCETGEIGCYMLYSNLDKEKVAHGTKDNRNSAKSGKLQRER